MTFEGYVAAVKVDQEGQTTIHLKVGAMYLPSAIQVVTLLEKPVRVTLEDATPKG